MYSWRRDTYNGQAATVDELLSLAAWYRNRDNPATAKKYQIEAESIAKRIGYNF
jgi:hypothetical protein